ncbi:hypothetical protein [Kribbella sp. NPDC055071]
MDATVRTLGWVQALWFVVLAVVGLRRAVRFRALVTHGIGLLVSLVVTTTATPPEKAVPIGVMIGTGIAIGLSLATRHGVTFTWQPDTEYWPDDKRPPRPENLLLALAALYFIAAAVVAATR